MTPRVKEVVRAFELLFESIRSQKFSKTLALHEYSERELLPLVRTFLLGYFGKSLIAEASSKLPGSRSGNGRVDFLIGNLAVELAVRTPGDSKSAVSSAANSSEVKKLMKHNGMAILILFDFSKTPYSIKDIERFRQCPSLGKGNHNKSAFNVAYFYIESWRPIKTGKISKNIRVT